jgi:S-adenosylmethionine:tRNA ribosyltransferase-isomerase
VSAAAVLDRDGQRLVEPLPLSFTIDADHQADQPPEAGGAGRDDVHLLVSRGTDTPQYTTFASIANDLRPGDLLVVNTSATVAAALDVVIEGHGDAVIHVSNQLPGDLWMVEPRRRIANGSTERLRLPDEPALVHLHGGRPLFHLLRTAPDSERLWLALATAGADVAATMAVAGRPIRYQYVPRDWPLGAYQTVFATDPGSAEMPSAGRPFTAEIVTRLVSKGVAVAPITLHTGVSSLEAGERPSTERYRVPSSTAMFINATHHGGGHVIAVGTTVVRALETVTDSRGTVHPGEGWTDVIIDPKRGVRSVDGLLTGWHEPEATHLAMLEAIAGRDTLVTAYESAFAAGYRWHEFGDSHLILPYA